MKILVLGADGFCGWPTTLHLLAHGHEVDLVDNLSRRAIDDQLGVKSLTKIASIDDRIRALPHPSRLFKIDVAKDLWTLDNVIKNGEYDTIIHFAEQRSAPYSMIDDAKRRYTVDNNIIGTHNILSVIVDMPADRRPHLVHLGTMGVYGYSKEFGPIPEGYLDVNITTTNEDTSILYPTNPGSIYHMTKSLDQIMFQFYNKNWGLQITDLHQGIVWGTDTEETQSQSVLFNRFDYDGLYGTVLNRFISQAANNEPLTVYGTGGQARAFIHISDTVRCVRLAAENPPDTSRVRIFNQVSEVKTVLELAEYVQSHFGGEIDYMPNPRKELAENELEVSNAGLKSLGFTPTLLSEKLVEDVELVAKAYGNRFDRSVVRNSPKW